MRIWLLLTMLTFSFASFAQLAEPEAPTVCEESDERSMEEIEKSKERQVCPNLTEDAKTLLSSIKTLEDELKKSPACQSVLDKVSVISNITTKTKWKELVNVFSATDPSSGNGAMGSMETKDIEDMSKHATEAAVALADTIALLSGSSSHCMPKERASFLSSLSQVTKEISTVVGSIASGPMGPGVSIVGNMIASSIAGIDKLFKNGKVYDFKKPAERVLFMNQFCAFTEIQQDINDYLNLKDKSEEIKNLQACYLSKKIQLTTENCRECKGYELAFRENIEASRIIGAIIEDSSIVAVGDLSLQHTEFSRCGEINRAIYTRDSDLFRYVARLKKYVENNDYISSSDKEQIEEFTRAFDLIRSQKESEKHVFPRYSECVTASNEDVRRWSIRFNSYIRDEVVGFHHKIFAQQMAKFRADANRIYPKINGQTKAGDSISKSMDIEKWAKEEGIRIHQKLSEVNYRKSREEVMIQQNLLRDRMTAKLMPHYLKYLFGDTMNRMKSFRKEIDKVIGSQISYYNDRMRRADAALLAENKPAIFNKNMTTLEELTEAIKKDKQMAAELVSAFDRAFRNYDIVDLRVKETERYCDYLTYTVTMLPVNRDICLEGIDDMNNELVRNTEAKSMRETIMKFNDWARKNIQLHSTYVASYAQKMRNFIATSGPDSPRWVRSDGSGNKRN